MNNSVTITVEERGTNDVFVPTGIVAGYIWNSAPIQEIVILRIIPAIGRELHFPININLNTIPKLTQNNYQATLYYLKFTYSSRHLSSAILKILIEDHRTAHTERINNNQTLVVLNPGDIFMARTAILSDKRRRMLQS